MHMYKTVLHVLSEFAEDNDDDDDEKRSLESW